jgi:hypothetical protein
MLPWISKVRVDGRKIVADLFTFMDDFHPTGPRKKEVWLVGHRAASTLNQLGIQDALQKRRDKELEAYTLFIFTDNTTMEAAFWKGASRSRKLFDLAFRLRKLEMEHDMIIHVVHVSRK